MRKMLFLGYLLGVSCVAAAQTPQGAWTNLSKLAPGQKILIVEVNSKSHPGTFENVSDSAISIKDSAGEASIQKQDVRSVKLMRSNRRLRNTLIGAGIGAGTGAAIGATAWESHGFLHGKGTGAAICAGLGGLTGILVGAVLPTHDTIYEASSR